MVSRNCESIAVEFLQVAQHKRKTLSKKRVESESEGAYDGDSFGASILRLFSNADSTKEERVDYESQASLPFDERVTPSVHHQKEAPLF